MFSNESNKNADACRFCWMCRHICPVAAATGNEAWTPRARGLMVSMVERGTEFDEGIADNMYQCSMCEACSNDCITGFKPSSFTRQARTEAVAKGLAPAGVMKSIDALQSTGNIYGKKPAASISKAVKELPEKADTLLYLGQSAKTTASKSGLAIMSLLNKAGVKYTCLKNEPASGAFLADLIGYTGDVQEQAKKVAKAVKDSGCKKLVVVDPHDGAIFKEQYQEWKLLSGIEVVTITAFLAELIDKKKLKVKKDGRAASFQDPCKLARTLEDTESPRKILSALGIDLKEFFLHGKMARCCGGEVLDSYSPDVVKKMVLSREDDAVRIGSSEIITACPGCSYLMDEYSDGKVKITDLYTLLDEHC